VVLVEDDAQVRSFLQQLMEREGFEVEAYGAAADFLASYRRRRPECLVIDLRLPDGNGLEIQQALQERGEDPPLLFLSGSADITLAVRAMKAGALDFLEKPIASEALLQSVRFAIDRDERHARDLDRWSVLEELTPREREILDLVVEGQASKRIALDLGISVRTVELHRSHIMQKTRAGSIAELVRLVMDARGGRREAEGKSPDAD